MSMINKFNQNMIYEGVEIGENFTLGFYNVIGCPREHSVSSINNDNKDLNLVTTIGTNCRIANHSVIYEGAIIGDNVLIDDYVRIGSRSKIGDNTLLLYGVRIYENVSIGINCKIAGFIPNHVVIGDNVSMMGNIVHRYGKPLDWDNKDDSPIIEESVVVGYGATLVGGINIGKNSYIAANATLTKDVPPDSIVINTNQIIPLNKWKGRMREDLNAAGDENL